MPEPEPYIALIIQHDKDQSPSWLLELFDVEGIESEINRTKGYWPKEQWKGIKNKLIEKLHKNSYTDFRIEDVPFINWNAKWESGFDPIRIADFCFIRAPFHPPADDVRFDIVIDPKMAFGTGHHATTWQMIEKMSYLKITGRSVLDYGAGTGILSILADKMQARKVLAIDNDLLAVENMNENFQNNGCPGIEARQSTLEQLEENTFDIILANINRNVLMASVKGLSHRAKPNTDILISGFYAEELPMLTEAFDQHWTCVGHSVKDQWCCAHFQYKQA